ncbi:hypothetical protein [Sebaldella sp. S0638]|uniref:hypothetical protein n=1 Tax=Sebaldella sp. S0638 TaxID=2957809 RepID=UPI00209EF414|nr:hypothetical protein [Sebaldella sp. S0638]MCP1226513.1 hypothetical protein [Sebaldella sp. S0638]
MDINKNVSVDERYLLDIDTGICHDLDNFEIECGVEKLTKDHIFCSDSLYSEVKRHPSYKKKCKFCMNPKV